MNENRAGPLCLWEPSWLPTAAVTMSRRTFHSSFPGQALGSPLSHAVGPGSSAVTHHPPGGQPALHAEASPDLPIAPAPILLCLSHSPSRPPQTPPTALLLSPLPVSCPSSHPLLCPHHAPCPFRSCSSAKLSSAPTGPSAPDFPRPALTDPPGYSAHSLCSFQALQGPQTSLWLHNSPESPSPLRPASQLDCCP